MLQIAIISGDLAIGDSLASLIAGKTTDVRIEEGVHYPTDVHQESLTADFILLDVQLLQISSLQNWKKHAKDSKIILVSTFANEAKALNLLGKGANGLFTKSIDQRKWSTAIYYAGRSQSPREHYFTTQIIPRILQWEAVAPPLEKNTLELEAAIIRLMDTGQTVREIACKLQLDPKVVSEYKAVIEQVRSA